MRAFFKEPTISKFCHPFLGVALIYPYVLELGFKSIGPKHPRPKADIAFPLKYSITFGIVFSGVSVRNTALSIVSPFSVVIPQRNLFPDASIPPYQKQPPKEQPFQLLVDIQGKMAEGKSVGYKKWATKFNLKEMSKTLLFLQEQKISSADELRERAAAATERYHAMGDSIKAAEARLTEIAVLKTHIINYAKTRPVYDAYRKSGYSKKYLEAHREEITLHKAAKAVFDEAGLQKLPKVKALDAEFAELLTKKKAAYPDYRKARNEMQELVRAQKNVERFFAEEKQTHETEQVR